MRPDDLLWLLKTCHSIIKYIILGAFGLLNLSLFSFRSNDRGKKRKEKYFYANKCAPYIFENSDRHKISVYLTFKMRGLKMHAVSSVFYPCSDIFSE